MDHDVVPIGAQGGRGRRIREVRKDLELSPQYAVGIPATRTNPISPLAMHASAGIMAGAMIGASGKRVSKRRRKAIDEQAYALAMGNGMLYSPIGFGRAVTG